MKVKKSKKNQKEEENFEKEIKETVEILEEIYDEKKMELWNIKEIEYILKFFQKDFSKKKIKINPLFLKEILKELTVKYTNKEYNSFDFGIFLSSIINWTLIHSQEKKEIKINLDLKNLPDLKGIGFRNQQRSFLVVNGDVGDLFVSQMEGGKVILNGSAQDLAGKEMKNGKVEISGNVGNWLAEKMRGGRIVIKGNVGRWTGKEMKDGILIINGSISSFDETIFSFSNKGVIFWQEEKIFEKGRMTKKGETFKGKSLFKIE